MDESTPPTTPRGQVAMYHFAEDLQRIRAQGFDRVTLVGVRGVELWGVLMHGSPDDRHAEGASFTIEVALPGDIDLSPYAACGPDIGWAWCIPPTILQERLSARLMPPRPSAHP